MKHEYGNVNQTGEVAVIAFVGSTVIKSAGSVVGAFVWAFVGASVGALP